MSNKKNLAPMIKCISQKYVCNEKTGIVVAICTFEWNVPSHVAEVYDYSFDTIITSRGVARCASDDVYNEKIGRKIAYTKARSRALARFSRSVATMMKKLNPILDELEDSKEAFDTDKIALDIRLCATLIKKDK
jgi:hypothetical protein